MVTLTRKLTHFPCITMQAFICSLLDGNPLCPTMHLVLQGFIMKLGPQPLLFCLNFQVLEVHINAMFYSSLLQKSAQCFDNTSFNLS